MRYLAGVLLAVLLVAAIPEAKACDYGVVAVGGGCWDPPVVAFWSARFTALPANFGFRTTTFGSFGGPVFRRASVFQAPVPIGGGNVTIINGNVRGRNRIGR